MRVVVGSFLFELRLHLLSSFINYATICVSELVCKTYVSLVVFSSILSRSYHLRPPPRGTTGVVSIRPWVEKGPSN